MAMEKMKEQYQYVVTIESRREYLGTRYFAFSLHSDSVIQVVIAPGEGRRGRNNTIGVHCIATMSFMSNYHGMGYTRAVTKREYLKAFDKVITIMRPK